MENYESKQCPVCNLQIKEGEATAACPSCGTAHHQACWEQNGGCAAEHCTGAQQPAQEESAQPPVQEEKTQAEQAVCQSCGTALQADQKFCTKCGAAQAQATAQAARPSVCGHCGAQLLEGKPFCPKCGQKSATSSPALPQAVPSQPYPVGNGAMPYTYAAAGVVQTRQKSKVLPVVLSVAAVFLVIVVGLVSFFVYAAVQTQKRTDAIDMYLSTANDLCYEITNSGSKLEDIGNKMQTYWYNHIWKDGSFYDEGAHITTTDVTDAVMQAQKKMADELVYVKAKYDTIQALYSQLNTLPVDDDALYQIYITAMDANDAYVDLYTCVTDPSGNYKTWTSNFGDYDLDLSVALKSLQNQVDAYTFE